MSRIPKAPRDRTVWSFVPRGPAGKVAPIKLRINGKTYWRGPYRTTKAKAKRDADWLRKFSRGVGLTPALARVRKFGKRWYVYTAEGKRRRR